MSLGSVVRSILRNTEPFAERWITFGCTGTGASWVMTPSRKIMRIRGIAASTTSTGLHTVPLRRTLPVAGSASVTATAGDAVRTEPGTATSAAGLSNTDERRVDQMLGQEPAL